MKKSWRCKNLHVDPLVTMSLTLSQYHGCLRPRILHFARPCGGHSRHCVFRPARGSKQSRRNHHFPLIFWFSSRLVVFPLRRTSPDLGALSVGGEALVLVLTYLTVRIFKRSSWRIMYYGWAERATLASS